ncbi:MAG: hypothetical protein KY449_03705, partial [Proteobacteria bacterium]|nr:hypothetical protein [Pseudomonadota bacterium]
FGHFPGKDRTPREAAASGSVILIHRRGAGAQHEDFPIGERYKFNEQDVLSGALNELVTSVLREPGPAWRDQAPFRDSIRKEKLVFDGEIARLVFG